MTHDQWMDKVRTCVSELEELGVPVGVSTDRAQAELRAVGRGRNRAVLYAAQKMRRGEEPVQPASTIFSDVVRAERAVGRAKARLAASEARLAELRLGSRG